MIALSDRHLTIKEVASVLPGRPNVSTIWRWIKRGARGRKLRATHIGGRTFISESDLNEFLANDHSQEVTASRQAELRRVDRELDDLLK